MSRKDTRTALENHIDPKVVDMVANPCHGELVHGLHGSTEGLLTRTRRAYTKKGGDIDTAGFFIWCPEYTPIQGASGQGSRKRNAFAFRTDDPSAGVANTALDGFGTVYDYNFFTENSAMSNACNLLDPAGELADQAMVDDIRTLSACAVIQYTGREADASGQFCTSTTLPLSALVPEVGETLSVDDVFQLCGHSHRLGLDEIEIIARPSEDSAFFSGSEGSFTTADFVSTESRLDEPIGFHEPRCIVFAWRGLDAAAKNPMAYTLTKNVEWRPTNINGVVRPKFTEVLNEQAKKVSVLLDSVAPSWGTRFKGAMVNVPVIYKKVHKLIKEARTAKNAGNHLISRVKNVAGPVITGTPIYAGVSLDTIAKGFQMLGELLESTGGMIP